jgi:hypothetical protein
MGRLAAAAVNAAVQGRKRGAVTTHIGLDSASGIWYKRREILVLCLHPHRPGHQGKELNCLSDEDKERNMGRSIGKWLGWPLPPN